MVMDREAWRAAVHGSKELHISEQLNNNNTSSNNNSPFDLQGVFFFLLIN